MNDTTYAAPAAAVPGPPIVRARLHTTLTSYRRESEIVRFFLGDQAVGLAVLPPDAAYDLISRLEDIPPSVSLITPRVAGHVRYALEHDYNEPCDEPPDWIFSLILLIHGADPDQRRRLTRSYPDYCVCVAVATNTADGLEVLRDLHEQLVASAPPAPRGG